MSSAMERTGPLLLLLTIWTIAHASRERIHKISDTNSIPLPLNDETVLTCEMNVAPDRFQWRFYPLGVAQATNPNAPFNLSKTNFVDLPPHTYLSDKKSKSILTIKLTNYSMAGDYQCLAHYGASVIASVPDRITVTTLENFPSQYANHVTVTVGNTVLWRCDPPYSNPPAYIDYSKDGMEVPPIPMVHTTSLILANLSMKDSGEYKCKAMNSLLQKDLESPGSLNLKVVRSAPNQLPKIIITPKSSYTVKRGENVFLECAAVGTPVPNVTWSKRNGQLQASRMSLLPGGLQITDVVPEDEGVYVCKHTNIVGTITHQITLIYNEAPVVIEGPNSTSIKEGENLELRCLVKGMPEPQITWLLNGNNVLNDKQIESIGNRIYFMAIEKGHAGTIQCFATNLVGTTYTSADLSVIPKQISSSDTIEEPQPMPSTSPNHKRRKHKKNHKHKGTSEMIPPSKPTISRVNDESVVVRWSVPSNDGLPIQFFKVQYRELGPTNGEDYGRGRSSRWKTTNLDIAPNIRSYEVNTLKPDHVYKFRIAAVYSNNDNKLSPKSDKFYLNRTDFYARNPLPVPNLTHAAMINSTSIQIFWEHKPHPNITVDGFFINYMSASSAGDYMKATVDGENINSTIITHLIPDTVYDIKMQSFNTKSASEFSPILKRKTAKVTTESPLTTTIRAKEASQEQTTDSSMYIFIGGGVIVVALLLSVVVLLIICRKWKQNKDTDSQGGDRGDKPAVEEINHHIQADANDYVVSPKNLPRNNGCAIPTNRITITANPLADADNKSQNMIEMSCLSSQNNNCASSASTQQQQEAAQQRVEPGGVVVKGKHKSKRRKNAASAEPPPGENYV